MAKGRLRVVEGDVTDPQFTAPNEVEVAIICHVCNNGVNGDGVGVMGAGVALALKNKWQLVHDSYKAFESKSPKGLKNRLGEICNAIVEKNIIVVNMIAQDGIKSADNPIPIKYWALQKCLELVRTDLIAALSRHVDYKDMIPVIHCPEFGGLRAGGKFEFILELIREQWLEYGIDVVVYKYVE